MSDLLQDVDLPSDSLNICLVLNLILLKDFYRHQLVCDGMSANPHFSKRALAQGFA
jgi:hypothetical protein